MRSTTLCLKTSNPWVVKLRQTYRYTDTQTRKQTIVYRVYE